MSAKLRLAIYLFVFILVWGNLKCGLALQTFQKLCDVKDYDDFLKQTGKVYTNEKERQFRESIFLAKKNVVDLTNKYAANGLGSYQLAINPLADMTRDEVIKLTGSKITYSGEELTAKHTNFVTAKANIENLPEFFDWREKGCVTPPGFQGFDCGSCWSFSAVGAVEGHLCRRTGVLVPLSEQNLIDCADEYGCEGCEGGFQEYGLEYIRDHGISLASQYPYTQMEGSQCLRNDTDKGGVQIRDYARIKPGDEEKMKEVIATLGPLACSMNGAPISFEQYMGGIYDDDECNQEDVNHSVVVVGYGTEDGKDYWILKNSYSENWGENGFMRLIRNADGFCGIASECSYPIL